MAKILHGFAINSNIESVLYSVWLNQKVLCFSYLTEYEKERIRRSLKGYLNFLDEKKVPFIVQNEILNLAQKGKSFKAYFDKL